MSECSKNHIKIQWNEAELFTCPLCVVKDANDNLREVRNYQENQFRSIMSLCQNSLNFKR